jgi:hypothetical protein
MITQGELKQQENPFNELHHLSQRRLKTSPFSVTSFIHKTHSMKSIASRPIIRGILGERLPPPPPFSDANKTYFTMMNLLMPFIVLTSTTPTGSPQVVLRRRLAAAFYIAYAANMVF